MNTKRITRSAALGLALIAVAAPAAGAQQDLRNPDTIDAAAGRGTDSSPDVVVVKIPAQTPSTAVSADGLDWQDAGIGAGGLLAVGLIGLGGTLVVHRRRGAAPTPSAR